MSEPIKDQPMNASKAREIIEHGSDCSCNGITESCNRDAIWIQKKELAEMYLAALEGPEVYELLDFIDTVRQSAHARWRKAATRVLDTFRMLKQSEAKP